MFEVLVARVESDFKQKENIFSQVIFQVVLPFISDDDSEEDGGAEDDVVDGVEEAGEHVHIDAAVHTERPLKHWNGKVN